MNLPIPPEPVDPNIDEPVLPTEPPLPGEKPVPEVEPPVPGHVPLGDPPSGQPPAQLSV